LRIINLFEIIAGYLAFTYGSRNISKYNYFINLYPQKWIRRLLLLQDSGSLSLAGIVLQSVVTLLTITCLLNWFGINVLSRFGDFKSVFSILFRKAFWFYLIPLIAYTAILGFLKRID